MKKIDTSKPAIHTRYKTPATFLCELKRPGGNLFVYKCVSSEKSNDEYVCEVGEFGENPYTDFASLPLIKNVPETITFWVRVWRSKDGGIRLGQPVEMQDKPEKDYDSPDFVKWAGPFTFEVD